MPRRRPRISCAPTADLSQTPACMSVIFWVSRRVSEMISAIASSTTLRVLENGALNTATPREPADARSIWLVPMQNAPMASRSGAWASTAAVTSVLERIPSSCTPGSASTSSVSSYARSTSWTSQPPARSRSTASGWTDSSSSARTLHFIGPPNLSARSGSAGAADTGAGDRTSGQPLGADRLAADFTHAVVAVVDAAQRIVDVVEGDASLLQQGADASALEGDRRSLRVVLVVRRDIAGRLDHGVDVAGQGLDPAQGGGGAREKAS